jgi:hypothetical protein
MSTNVEDFLEMSEHDLSKVDKKQLLKDFIRAMIHMEMEF